MRRRLLVVTEYFWPDGASTGKLLGELIEQLGNQSDLDITVLTSDRLYRTTTKEKLPREEMWGRVSIRRVHSLRSGNDRFARRLLSDTVFAIHAIWHALWCRYDCLLVGTNPPLAALLLAHLATKARPLVYLIHDLYPDLPVSLRMWSSGSPVVRLLTRWQRATLQGARAVIVLGRCMKGHIMSCYGVPDAGLRVIPNWYTISPSEVPPFSTRPSFIVVYGGNLGEFQDFDTLLDAAELLRSHENVEFYICGNGSRRPYIETQVKNRDLRNVVLREFVPEDEFAAILRAASLGVVTLGAEVEGLSVPSKSYNIMAMGVPLLAIMSEKAEIARVISETECGVRVDHGQARLLAKRIAELSHDPNALEEMSKRARHYAMTEASLLTVAGHYLQVIHEAIEEATQA